MRYSPSYQLTLPVINGGIVDPDGDLARIRLWVRQSNALRVPGSARRQIINLKYRGPRVGNRYNTPRDTAYAVDVYVSARTDYPRE
jgi:hypothetical protein